MESDEFRLAHTRTWILTGKCRRMQDELADTTQEHIISSFCAHRKPQFPRITRTKTDSRDCTASARLVEFMGRGLCRIRWYVVISNIASRTQRWKEDRLQDQSIANTDFIRRNTTQFCACKLSCKLLLVCDLSIVLRAGYCSFGIS